MKSLKAKFKTSSRLVQEGVWFDVAENSDKTICRVRLRRSGRSNRDWVTAFRDRTSAVDMEVISSDEDEQITADVFVTACVVDWENMQPEDDGNPIPFSKEAAMELLSNPDWIDLLKELQTKAMGVAGFQEKKKVEAGN